MDLNKIEKLQNLTSLYQNGAIDKNEFEILKKEILNLTNDDLLNEKAKANILINQENNSQKLYNDNTKIKKNIFDKIVIWTFGIIFTIGLFYLIFPEIFDELKTNIFGINNWSGNDVQKFNYGFIQLRNCVQIKSVKDTKGNELSNLEINTIIEEFHDIMLNQLSYDFKSINEINNLSNSAELNSIILVKYSAFFGEIIKKYNIDISSIKVDIKYDKIEEIIKELNYSN